ncbi:MAG: hypothetical protein PHE86_06175 [Candidatus Marinimicrobia bacterium]|nr:hypothetical protein [Candidatus Neomarinimicrobiota bacterium]MDD5582205.1 hypothetical protein [Candidatus Neomarinimicrobiota bacterium]
MARPSGFGAKIANRQKEGKKCPVCGEAIVHLKVFKSVSTENQSVKYNQKMVSVCACNKQEIFN